MPQPTGARGFGGGFGGGGSRGGFGGGGFGDRGFREGGGFEGSGFRGGGYSGGGYHPGGLQAGGYSAPRAALPTDAGFGGGEYRGRGFEPSGGYRAAGVEAVARPGGVGAGAYRPAAVGAEGAAERAAGYGTQAVSSSVAAARASAVRDSFHGYGMFGQNWYGDHPGAWYAAGWHRGANYAWNTATWPAVGAWCGWPEDEQPVYYDYGSNITYQGDQVYSGGQPVASANEYYQQAATLAQGAPAPDPNDDWMPLGVFSLVRGNQSESNIMLQLAVNKSGAITGNSHTINTGNTLPIQGAVDKKTQRAAWTVGADKNRVYDTGISNLTMDEAPILVHLGSNITQQWMLVRLKQP